MTTNIINLTQHADPSTRHERSTTMTDLITAERRFAGQSLTRWQVAALALGEGWTRRGWLALRDLSNEQFEPIAQAIGYRSRGRTDGWTDYVRRDELLADWRTWCSRASAWRKEEVR